MNPESIGPPRSSNASRTARALNISVLFITAGYCRAISSWLRVLEVLANPRLESVEIGIDKISVAAGFHARKRNREQVGQCRALEPILAHCRLCEWQAERQDRLDGGIEHVRFRLRCRRQFREFGLSPQMAEADPGGRGMVGFAYQRRNRCSQLDTYWIAFGGKDARVRRTVRRHLAGLVLVAEQSMRMASNASR